MAKTEAGEAIAFHVDKERNRINQERMSLSRCRSCSLTNFIQSQACGLSPAGLDRLIVDLPVLRERSTKIPSQTYPYLFDQLEFLSLVVKDRVAGLNRDLTAQTVAEAAFALLYFQNPTDLIPDSIPGMGLLDDAMIVSMVLRRHEHAFKRSSHSYKLHWRQCRGRSLMSTAETGPKRFVSQVARTRHFPFMSFDNFRVARNDKRLT